MFWEVHPFFSQKSTTYVLQQLVLIIHIIHTEIKFRNALMSWQMAMPFLANYTQIINLKSKLVHL